MLPPWLTDNVRDGDAILFLGAGALRGARGRNGEVPLNGNELRDRLADRFLGGAHKAQSLARVAEYAKSESSLQDVQAFIGGLFDPLEPPSHYALIPTFRWYAIVTTNYDLCLERAYAGVGARLQDLQPILRDGDRLTAVLRKDKAVPYLKLHGCISQLSDPNLPLILATEEYAKHRKNRERLFRYFEDWARERPVIFAGYDIADPNILQILFDLTDMGINRPRYAVVDPALDDIAVRYWSSKRFAPVPKKFHDFLADLESAIPRDSRVLAALRTPRAESYQKWIATHTAPSDRLRNYLATELTHVHPNLPTPGTHPRDFYSGEATGWGAIASGLNVKRRVGDDVILDCVLTDAPEPGPRVFLLRGHAGAGLTVALRQIAWEAARDFEALVLFLNEGGLVRPDLIAEFADLVRCRLLLVVDDAIANLADISNLVARAKTQALRIDVLISARTNEWNVAAAESRTLDHAEYELRDLTDHEIKDLIEKLKVHGCLGELEKLSLEQQVDRFRQFAGRQLIVALHEATTGRPLEELVLDEYQHLTPARAKILYLDICTLHRLGVSIRAGLVARVSGISFADFSSELFKPLEHVVFSYLDHGSRDYAYRTRHPLIAQFVFEQALPDPVERAGQIKRIIRHMNVDYESDAAAFSQLIKGKTLADLFADKGLAKEIFEAALEAGAPRGYVHHQRAVFELAHPGGDLRAALAAINEAEAQEPYERHSIEHTKATVLRRLALDSLHALERDRHRTDAKQLLQRLVRSRRTPHAVSTLVQIGLDELRELVAASKDLEESESELQQRAIAEQIRMVEQTIYSGLQQFPGDEFLLALDAQLSDVLKDYPRALNSLQEAFNANPARPFIAVRLATFMERSGKIADAKGILERCLAANPGTKECHLELALLLMNEGEQANISSIGYHLKRSFTEGDSNLLGQFWWARHEYLYGDRSDAMRRFQRLGSSRIAFQLRHRVLGAVVGPDGRKRRLGGLITSPHPSYCFVRCDELNASIFVPSRSFDDQDWQRAHGGVAVSFFVAFSARGPEGLNAELA